VRELEASGEAGFNRVVWDLRARAPEGVPNARGPFVLPGPYRVYLSTPVGSVAVSLRVDWDPELSLSDEERARRYRFLTDAGRLQERIQGASAALAAVRKQLTDLQEPLKGVRGNARLADGVSRFTSSIEQLQRRLGGGSGGDEEGGFGGGLRSRVNGLVGEIDGGGVQQGTLAGPTTTQSARLVAATADVEAFQADFDRLLGPDLEQVNDRLARARLPRITLPAEALRRPTSSQP
jgi:hypothetical protein